MKLDFQRLMVEAGRMTRVGDLRAATTAIQNALRQRMSNARASMPDDAGNALERVERSESDAVSKTVPEFGPGAAPAAPMPHPGGISNVTTGRHADGHGGRDYRLFVPPQAGNAPLPLVVMLHGCTQNADDFAAGTAVDALAEKQGFYVLYPEQSAQANPQRCWNWFKHNHQQRDRGEPALLAGMVKQVMSTHRVDPARVYVAGLSAGGAMAAILGATYPEIFAAVGVHSGLAAGAATDLPSALAAMRQGGPSRASAGLGVPTIVFHGDADATVHPSNGEHVVAASAGSAEISAERIESAAGRAATRRVHRTREGRVLAEHWLVHGAAHAWSGGTRHGSYTDPQGPDATVEMLRFFFQHPRSGAH